MTSCPSSIGSTQGRQGLFPGGTASAASSAAPWSSRFIITSSSEREFELEGLGYTATRHQAEVGTGYFDRVSEVVSAGDGHTAAPAPRSGAGLSAPQGTE